MGARESDGGVRGPEGPPNHHVPRSPRAAPRGDRWRRPHAGPRVGGDDALGARSTVRQGSTALVNAPAQRFADRIRASESCSGPLAPSDPAVTVAPAVIVWTFHPAASTHGQTDSNSSRRAWALGARACVAGDTVVGLLRRPEARRPFRARRRRFLPARKFRRGTPSYDGEVLLEAPTRRHRHLRILEAPRRTRRPAGQCRHRRARPRYDFRSVRLCLAAPSCLRRATEIPTRTWRACSSRSCSGANGLSS